MTDQQKFSHALRDLATWHDNHPNAPVPACGLTLYPTIYGDLRTALLAIGPGEKKFTDYEFQYIVKGDGWKIEYSKPRAAGASRCAGESFFGAEWKDMENRDRKSFIGGSDLAAVLGISPWKTPYQLWEEKVGLDSGTEDDAAREKVLRRGKRLEPVVMEMLQDEYDLTIIGRNQVFTDFQYDLMRAEIDFQYIRPDGSIGNGDVKTVHVYAARDWGEAGTDQVPSYYVAQFQWGMMVNGANVCAVAALFGADDLRLYYVHRDEEIINMIRARATEFWEKHVLPEVPPPMQTAEDAEQMLAKFGGVTVTATPELQTTLDNIKRIKAAEKRLAAKREEYETMAKIELAASTIDTNDGNFQIVDDSKKVLASWNLQTAMRISASKVKELYPDLVSKVSETSTFRVLRIK